MKRGALTALSYIGILAIGIYLGYLLPFSSPIKISSNTDVSEDTSQYQFVNPLLFCSDINVPNAVADSINSKVSSYIQSQEKAGALTDASVYYKDLNFGPWTLINGDMRSIPASLLKVPTAIGIYAYEERNPGFLKNTATLEGNTDYNSTQYFAPKHSIATSTPYTLKQLVQYMLEDSDNGALYLLGTTMNPNDVADAYSNLGIDPPDSTGYTITVKTYASFFRTLFNASYLSRDDSEYLLSLLAHSDFTQGLVAGVPAGITVSHKFGEFTTDDTHKQLNDCGIIYRAHNPFILCVMTKGSDYEKLASVIAGISQTVWSTVSTQNQ